MSNGFMGQYWRVGGACGILFIVMFVIGAIIQSAEPPMFDDPVEEIRAFWVDEGNTWLLGDYFIGLGFILFFLPFVSALRSLLGQAEGDSQMWSRLVFAGGVLVLAIAAAAGASWTALAWGDVAENASDETIQMLMWVDVGATHFIPAGMAIMALPAAMVMLRTRVLPLWLGGLTLLFGVIVILSMLAILSDDPDENFSWLPFPAMGIWILVTSIYLVTRKAVPAAAMAESVAPASAV